MTDRRSGKQCCEMSTTSSIRTLSPDEFNFYVQTILKENSMNVRYQPVVDHQHDCVIGFEALSRPFVNGKRISSEVFFDMIGNHTNSADIDLLALSKAAKNIPDDGYSLLFVNALPHSIGNKVYLDWLNSILANGEIHPDRLIIEITEHVAFDASILRERVKGVRSLGVRIALDDIGSGTANLRSLVDLEPDFVKIDRALIRNISKSEPKRRLLAHIAGFMESGDAVIAEGIENAADLFAVKEAGVNLSQGFYWAHPISPEVLSSLMSREKVSEIAL